MEAIQKQDSIGRPEVHDCHMPDVQRLQEQGVGICNICKYYQFTSANNKSDHKKLVHPRAIRHQHQQHQR